MSQSPVLNEYLTSNLKFQSSCAKCQFFDTAIVFQRWKLENAKYARKSQIRFPEPYVGLCPWNKTLLRENGKVSID